MITPNNETERCDSFLYFINVFSLFYIKKEKFAVERCFIDASYCSHEVLNTFHAEIQDEKLFRVRLFYY
jgi:hypothetical protein